MSNVPEPVPPYPHARNDCGLCREMDADFEIVEEALDPPSWNGLQPRRFCQGCIGRWMATMALTRPLNIPPATPWSLSVVMLRPGDAPR
ncbi:hypothetical protein ACFOY4_30910 [Actinomadura syzygii]|uniref:Uncharacterized protein n=1 Tax=Actinomadura syzygii TaxID=1427538 RepID=A0A5D0TTG9_9ACTN|nr:hypothetical protein [Actinomadura syzygii]TYC08730.1 hypothetical protein FXF65_38305 [Actinomadura syzygii]